jgi:hypothetical protein
VQACGTPVTGFNTPTDITLNGEFAYVTNFEGGTLSSCKVGADGALTDCADTGVMNLNRPTDMIVKGSNAYIVNYGSSSVTRCTIDATTGALAACTDAGALGLTSPIGIDIRENTAYITNNGDNSVSQCSIDGTSGALSCSSGKKYLSLGLASPYGVTVNGTSLYIVSQGSGTASPMMQSKITRCTVDATTGDLVSGSCATDAGYTVPGTEPTVFYRTQRMAIKGNLAYISNRDIGKVVQCVVDGTTGALSACATAEPALSGATGIAVK